MKNNQIRTVDELGRIVLPKSTREHFEIHTNDAVEIIETADGILLKKAPSEAKNQILS